MKREPLDTEGRLDPEVLAALLEGTLPAHERDEVLERLARSPADYEAFVEAASVLRDLEDESGAAPMSPSPPPPPPAPTTPPVREIRPARRRLPAPKLWLPLAAVLAGVLVVPRVLDDRASAVSLELLDGRTLVATPGDGSLASLGQEWNQPGWSVKRGGGQSLVEQHRDFRIGVRLAELDVALEAGDTQAVRRVAPELAGMVAQLEPGTGSEGVYQELTALATGSERGVDGKAAAARLAQLLQDSPWFGLGVWVEQARLAALAGRAEFFADRAAGDALDELIDPIARQSATGASVAARLRALRTGISRGVSSAELAKIRSELTTIIRESGG